MFIDHISAQLALEFIGINLASELVKYLAVKVFQKVDERNQTFLDLDEDKECKMVLKMTDEQMAYLDQIRLEDNARYESYLD